MLRREAVTLCRHHAWLAAARAHHAGTGVARAESAATQALSALSLDLASEDGCLHAAACMPPVVLVHGIMDSAQRIAPLSHGLMRRGIRQVEAIDLVPSWGTARIEDLAEQLARFVAETRTRHASESVDLVGFSMGGLVARTYLEQLGGATHVRTFISISAPHSGTLTAWLAPLAGVLQMRPGSALLRSLPRDVTHWPTAVHCIYTPYDLTVVPAETAVLSGAQSVHRIPVALHRWMLSDRRVLDLVAQLLGQSTDPTRAA